MIIKRGGTVRTVVITGGTRGIGRETVKLFAREGYRVAFLYCNSDGKAKELVDEVKAYGDITAVKCDVADFSQVEEAFNKIRAEFGRIYALVNNAGIAQQKLFTDITAQEWERMMSVNAGGVFNCCKASLTDMIHNKNGRIINISSMWGQVGASCEVHYSASKAAVIGLTKALAKEVGPSGITVNCIAPGVIDTDMMSTFSDDVKEALADETPLCRLGTPLDIAKAVLFLAGDSASFITGQVLGVNGGFII